MLWLVGKTVHVTSDAEVAKNKQWNGMTSSFISLLICTVDKAWIGPKEISKSFWFSMNNILKSKQTNGVQGSFDFDDMEISDESIKATKLNEYFSNGG